MPSAPRGRGGRGGGGGGGGLSRADKTAPIAVPSRDYNKSVNRRDYRDDTLEAREEARRREAEERIRARELGEQVDLGKAGEYWERIADTTKPVDRRPYPTTYKASTPVKPKSDWSTWEKPKSNGWDKWSEGKKWDEKGDVYAQKSSGSHIGHDSWNDRGSKEKQNQTWTNRDDGGGWNERNQHKTKSGADQRSQEDATTWNQSNSKPPDEIAWQNRGSEWSSTGEERKQNDEWVEQQASHEENSDHYAEMPSHLYEMLNKARQGAEPKLQILDLSGNQFAQKDLDLVIDFLIRYGVKVDTLRFDHNVQLQLESILDLLVDPQVGVGSLSELHVDACRLSPDTCWKLCECCACRRPSPAFRLCLYGSSQEECFGEGQILLKVFKTALRFDLRVRGLDTECREADLHVVAVAEQKSWQ